MGSSSRGPTDRDKLLMGSSSLGPNGQRQSCKGTGLAVMKDKPSLHTFSVSQRATGLPITPQLCPSHLPGYDVH
ncbi:unnamed protein product [Arctogadus glacialis]